MKLWKHYESIHLGLCRVHNIFKQGPCTWNTNSRSVGMYASRKSTQTRLFGLACWLHTHLSLSAAVIVLTPVWSPWSARPHRGYQHCPSVLNSNMLIHHTSSKDYQGLALSMNMIQWYPFSVHWTKHSDHCQKTILNFTLYNYIYIIISPCHVPAPFDCNIDLEKEMKIKGDSR